MGIFGFLSGTPKSSPPKSSLDTSSPLADSTKRASTETSVPNEHVTHKPEALEQRVEEERKQRENAEDTKKALLNILEDARELENQVKTERDRLETIIASIGEGIVVVNEKHMIEQMNPYAEHLLGITLEESKGKSWDTLINIYKNDQPLPEADRPINRMFSTQKNVTATIDENLSYETKSGTCFPVSLSTSPLIRDEKVMGGVIVFRDITHEKEEKSIIEHTVADRTKELREKNDALERAQIEVSQGWLQAQREKARLTASINSLPIGFILTDKDGSIFMLNSTAKKILGLKQDVYNVETLQAALGNGFNIQELLNKSKETSGIVRAHDILIDVTYMNITIVPILLEQEKEFLGSAIVVEDITERKITERARDEFFSIASHELRTPLTSIRGNTSMIQQYFSEMLKGNKELMEMIDDIHSSSVRLIQIVNDFLNVSRLEMKKMTYKKGPFNMKDLAEKVSKELEPNAQEKHDTLEVHQLTDPLPNAYADPDRVKEVLLNLGGNAVKFTDDGPVKTDISVKDGMIYVQVIDAGLGIPKERRDLLFRKFQQAGENIYTRDTSRSSGLGLYISKLMIEEMGGRIGLESSEVGKGSTFFFTLPIATGNEIPDTVSQPGGPTPTPTPTP